MNFAIKHDFFKSKTLVHTIGVAIFLKLMHQYKNTEILQHGGEIKMLGSCLIYYHMVLAFIGYYLSYKWILFSLHYLLSV